MGFFCPALTGVGVGDGVLPLACGLGNLMPVGGLGSGGFGRFLFSIAPSRTPPRDGSVLDVVGLSSVVWSSSATRQKRSGDDVKGQKAGGHR